jgi:hypothetical protein
MRTYPVYPESVGTTTGTSLTTLVDQLLLELEPLAQESKSILVNEIEPAFFTAASGMAIAEVVREILQSMLQCARKGRIHVFAEKFGDHITLEFEERNNFNGYALAFRLCSVEPLAREAGGYLSVKGEKSLLARISFSFPDVASKRN